MAIRIAKILCPTDFSESAKGAEEYACELARQFGAELHLLYVLQDLTLVVPEPGALLAVPAMSVDEARLSAERLLKTRPVRSTELKDIVRATRSGAPFVEIVRYAAEHDVDLIVMGTHGRSGLPHVLLGSVAEKVVRKAGCPVLTVRPRGHQFIVP